MHSTAMFIDLMLGVVEFVVINKALRLWFGRKGWLVALIAAAASFLPAIGGVVAIAAAIMILEWRWWIAVGMFGGGSAALAWTGGIPALVGLGIFF